MSRNRPENEIYRRDDGRNYADPRARGNRQSHAPGQASAPPATHYGRPNAGQPFSRHFQQSDGFNSQARPQQDVQREYWPQNWRQNSSRFDEGAAYGASWERSGRQGRAAQDFQQRAQNVDAPPSGSKKVNSTEAQMNAVAKDCIERLSESNEYVSLEQIENLFLEHYSVESLGQLNLRSLDRLPCIQEHIRCLTRVNLYIQTIIKVNAICTVHELSRWVKSIVPERRDFETLRLGPLAKLPVVIDHFYFDAPPDTGVCEICIPDVLEYLKCYLSENNLWRDRNASVEEFMTYMTEKRRLSTPYELGVRISNMSLATQTLQKVHQDCGQALRDTVARSRLLIENNLDTAFRHFASQILNKESNLCEVRKEYLRMPFTRVVSSLFTKLRRLYSTILEHEAGWELGGQPSGAAKARREELEKIQATLNDLKVILGKDVVLQRMMHMAICCSEEQIHEQLQNIICRRKDSSSSDESSDESEPKNLPGKDEIVASVIKYIEQYIAHGPLTLDKLTKIEEKLIGGFNLSSFSNLKQGSFLQFLLTTEALRKLLDESGGTVLNGSGPAGGSAFHATISDLRDFIAQCSYTEQTQHKQIEAAICHHYSVEGIKCLGHGTFANLVKAVEGQQQQHSGRSSNIFYTDALVSKQFPAALSPGRTTGPLGPMTKDQALACLQQCPLLEDMASWSQWDLVFKPQLKELKDFVQKYGGTQKTTVTDGPIMKTMTTNILALEVRPGNLLRLTSDTSPEKFGEAAVARNVTGTCGHLVSVIAVNGLENAPLALLANHFKTALVKIQVSQQSQQVLGPCHAKGQHENTEEIVRFVLDCIVKVPLVIGLQVINQVFLEGLSFLTGQTKSKELLLSCAQATDQKNHLLTLGILLGIKEWTECFQQRLESSFERVQNVDAEPIGLDIVVVHDSSAADGTRQTSPQEQQSVSENMAEVKSEGGNKSSTKPCVTLLNDSDGERGNRQETVSHVSDVEENKSDAMGNREEEGRVSDAGEKEHQCENIINQIRQEEFGLNVELNEDGTRLLTKQQERLGRTLERLSKDLYSKDTHFMLELIQNADDNDYPKQMMRSQPDLIPSLRFIVNHDSIIVYNNEVGFREVNIRAVCDVGRTTKGKHKFGYIGQKGIGFKSVFRVTDLPEIHSNGYHIQFDANSKPIGFILPKWLTKDQRIVDLPEEWTTCITLPLKDEMRDGHHSLSLADSFREIHPSLLLFLHRLRSIEVINKVERYESKMKRNDIGENIVEIEHKHGVDRWLVVRKNLNASKISLQAKSGVEVDSTEIALAFPMRSKEQIAGKNLPDRQPVFAFLPLRIYGFRFVVQGDFDVTSSREEVDRDSMWNQWLRNEIHQVFVNALEVFKSHSEFSVIEAVIYFLQFVPNPDEILDFFGPVAINILNLLKTKPCLPSQDLHWKLPSQLLKCEDPLVLEVVSASLLREHLALDFLHRDILALPNPPLLKSLGVQSLTTQHLIEVGKSIVANLILPECEDNLEHIKKVSKWLLCVSKSMNDFRDNTDILASLRSLRMIPLCSGEVVSLNEDSKTVFFPLSTLEKDATKMNLLAKLESDMRTVHPHLLGQAEDLSNLQIVNLLQQLGVKKLTPEEVIHNHILPSLRSPDAENKSRDLLVAYIAYIKEHFHSQRSALNEIKEAAILLTNQGPKRPHLECIHFTEAYFSCDLPGKLPGYPWMLVDNCYLQGSRMVQQVNEWKEFMKQLGVLDFLAVRQRKRILKHSELAESVWSSYKTVLPVIGEYHILDSHCEEFEALVTRNTESQSLFEQMKILFGLLDENWDVFYKQHSMTQITNSQGVPQKEVETSFGVLLKTAAWVPSELENKCELCNGSSVFVPSAEMRELMSNHVSYLVAPVLKSKVFSSFLQIQDTINAEFVVQQLLKWCTRSKAEPHKPVLFATPLSHMRYVYAYLGKKLNEEGFKDLLSHPFIFVPQPQDKNMGQFLSRQEVRWSDPTGLFDNYREALASLGDLSDCFRVNIDGLYHDLEKVFMNSFQVQQKPTVIDFVELLVQISLTTPLQKALRDVLLIFSTVGKELTVSGEYVMKLQLDKMISLMKHNKAIPSKRGRWVGLEHNVMIADDKQLEKFFDENLELDFVDCGEKLGMGRGRVSREDINSDYILKFLTSLGVEKLSNCIEINSEPEIYHPCPSVQLYVRDVLPFIQRKVYFYSAIYDFLVRDKGIKKKLDRMQFAQVSHLELIHSLKNLPQVPPIFFQQKCRIIKDQTMYVRRDCVDAYTEINRELARYFSCIGIPCPDEVSRSSEACCMELKNFFGEILPSIQSKSASLDEFINEHNLLSLPETDEPWEVRDPNAVFQQQRDQASLAADSEEEEDAGEDSGETFRLMSGSSGRRSANTHARSMWPPPAPWQHMDRSQLPSNLRPWSLQQREGENQGDQELYSGDDQYGERLESAESEESDEEGYQRNDGRQEWWDIEDAVRKLGPPMWPAQTDENIFEHLGSADELSLPQGFKLNEDSGTKEIGLWGELLVKDYLEKCQLETNSNIVEVVHVNQLFETYRPYDFVVRRQSGKHVTKVYIEVKTTLSNAKAYFQISLSQLRCAKRKGQNYHLYRVYSAGNPQEVRLVKIENLEEKLTQGKMSLMMAI